MIDIHKIIKDLHIGSPDREFLIDFFSVPHSLSHILYELQELNAQLIGSRVVWDALSEDYRVYKLLNSQEIQP